MLKALIAGCCGYLFVLGFSHPENALQTTRHATNCEDIIAAAKGRSNSEDPQDWKEAVNLYRQVLDCLPVQDGLQRARILASISKIQMDLGEFKEALNDLQPAHQLLQQISNGDIRLDKARVAGNLGLSLKILGRLDEALIYFQEALHLFQDLGDLSKQAKTLTNIGLVKFLRGENDAALTDYLQALELSDQIDPADESKQDRKAEALDLTGRVYAQMNDPRRAMLYFRQALPFASKAQDHRFRAYTLNDMGIVRLQQNQPVLAEHDHARALEEANAGGRDPDGIAESEALLADAQTAQGKYAQALGHYHAALALQEQTSDVIGQAQTHFSMGMLESRRKQWPNAQEELAHAADLYQQVHHRVGESNARFRAAEILAAEGDHPEAGSEVDQAIRLAEEVRNFTPGATLRTRYFASIDQMYRFQIDEFLDAKNPATDSNQVVAFEHFQRAQSRTLLDKLRARVSDDILYASNPDAARKKADQERRLADVLSVKPPPGEERDSLDSVWKLEGSLKEADTKLLADNPKLEIFSGIVSAQDIQQRILDSESALVQFYLSNQYSYAWTITQSNIHMVKLPSKKTLESCVRRTLQFGPAGDWTASQQAALATLRRSLAPVFAAARKKRWIVVPDGALHYFPFTLLTSISKQDRGPKEIIKIPSASAIDVVRRTSATSHPAYALAIFADPVFDKLDSGVKGSATMRAPSAENGFLPRLLHTKKEAEEIAGLFPPGQSRSWLRFAATKEAAAGSALQDFQNIHLATHSIVDEKNADRSRIVLSRVNENGKPLSGDFFLKDIYKMKLSADLVVLSSCQSALGKQQAGEGPISLSRAFLFAGAKAVVASLWEVNSDATGELMQRFYRYRQNQKVPPSTALAMSQADFRNHHDKRLRNPFYWAGFELYGEWKTR